MWVCIQSHGLHAVGEVIDLQTVKSKQRLRNIFDSFDTSCVGTAVHDIDAIDQAVSKDIFASKAKKCPDTAHFRVFTLPLAGFVIYMHEQNFPATLPGNKVSCSRVAAPAAGHGMPIPHSTYIYL